MEARRHKSSSASEHRWFPSYRHHTERGRRPTSQNCECSRPRCHQSHLFSLTSAPVESRHKGILREEGAEGSCNPPIHTYPCPLPHSSDPLPGHLSKARIPSRHTEALGAHFRGPTHPGYYEETATQFSFTKRTMSYIDGIFKTKR